MIVRRATIQDNEKLIALTGLAPMEGIISLRIDRKPDFFELLRKRGNYIVLVAELEQQLIGSVSCSMHYAVVNGNVYPVYYLGDLKVHPLYTRSPVAFRLLKAMAEELKRINADLVLCTTAAGNTAVQKLFKGARAGFTPFENTGVFKVHQLLPRKCNRVFPFISVHQPMARLDSFYQNYFSRFSLHPLIKTESDSTHYIWQKDQEIKAAATVFNPLPFKQNVVIGHPFFTGMLLILLRISKKVYPLPEVPVKNQPLKILYIRYYAFVPGAEKEFLAILKKIRHDAFQNGFHFVSFTVQEKDSILEKLVGPQSMFTFQSNGYITSLQQHPLLLKQINTGITFEDYSVI
ncbi:MAG: GNAT family N-acetyltransferase [Sphingobacteriales bacterium]|nr:MAG: GNAT family N-acetyltransferase [Sphingobacteriales bacterium]